MSESSHFQRLVDMGNPVGEVTGVNKFLITVKGLQPCNTHALIMFEDGSKGFVHQIYHDYVVILHLGETPMTVGTVAVVQHKELVAKVGRDFVGRVITVTGDPLDGKGPITAEAVWPVFNTAPPIYMREQLNQQLETGITLVDTLFPIVRGQRMALLGDSKSGKSTMVTQAVINQKNTDITAIYVMIAKKRTDVDELLSRLNAADGLKKSIVIVSNMFESLIMSYIAPYVGAAMAEYFWQKLDEEALIVYDDLTSHAQAYREVALISSVSPGRDSYPGDMFYAHSSLLERAGKLKRNHKTLTSLPLVLAPGNDVTAYLPTNIMSITDGQWIMDMDIFRDGKRPAISTGLSVTRVGGVGQSPRQHKHSNTIMKSLAAYRQAMEYAHFGSELALAAKKDMERGKMIYEVFNQGPTETFTFVEQQLMLDIILTTDDSNTLDIASMKKKVKEISPNVKDDKDDAEFEKYRDMLRQMCLLEIKKDLTPKPPASADATGGDDKKPDEKKDDKKDEKPEEKPEDKDSGTKKIEINKDGEIKEKAEEKKAEVKA